MKISEIILSEGSAHTNIVDNILCDVLEGMAEDIKQIKEKVAFREGENVFKEREWEK